MAEFKTEFKSKASFGLGGVLLALALAGAVAAAQFLFLTASLDAKAKAPIIEEILSRRVSQLGAQLSKVQESGLGSKEAAEIIAKAAEKPKIEIVSLTARRSGEDKYIARAQYTVNGKAPEDGKDVIYLAMESRMIGDWRVKWESSAFSYYTTLNFW